MQNGFCHEKGALSKAGIDTSAQRAIIPNVKKLVQICRDKGLPIVWTMEENYSHDVILNRRDVSRTRDTPGLCLRGSWDFQIVDELQSELKKEDFLVPKHKHSCFYNTILDEFLRARGTRTLIICGVATYVCVEAAVRDAYARDYDVILVTDCVAASRKDLHEAALETMGIYWARLIRLDETLNLFVPIR